MTQGQVDEYVAWLAAQRVLDLDEALAYSRRPRRWAGYEPPKRQPMVDHDNVVYLHR